MLCVALVSRFSSRHGQNQGLLLFTPAQQVGQHPRGEEGELHHIAELKELQVEAERPLEHGREVHGAVARLGVQYRI